MSLLQPLVMKTIRKISQSIQFWPHFMKFKYDVRRGIYENFPKVTYLRRNYGACNNPNVFGPYLRKHSEPKSENFTPISSGFHLLVITISTFEPS